LYLNIFLSQCCVQKCLMWHGPKCAPFWTKTKLFLFQSNKICEEVKIKTVKKTKKRVLFSKLGRIHANFELQIVNLKLKFCRIRFPITNLNKFNIFEHKIDQIWSFWGVFLVKKKDSSCHVLVKMCSFRFNLGFLRYLKKSFLAFSS